MSVTIAVLGSGCATCENLYEQTKKAAAELGITVEVEYSTDVQRLVALGLMSSPALVVNGTAVLVGSAPAYADLKQLLSKFTSDQ